jgi:hypothetical protein
VAWSIRVGAVRRKSAAASVSWVAPVDGPGREAIPVKLLAGPELKIVSARVAVARTMAIPHIETSQMLARMVRLPFHREEDDTGCDVLLYASGTPRMDTIASSTPSIKGTGRYTKNAAFLALFGWISDL